MKKFTWYLLLLIFFGPAAIAQGSDQQRLIEIEKRQKQLFEARKERLQRLADSTGIPQRIKLSEYKTAYLTDVIDGIPYYSSTHNKQARKTTNVEFLQSPGGLGLSLRGQGITVGVWDEGFVRNTHVEFGGRVTNRGGADFSLHSTHVAGTIAAAGINPDAKGMMPEARIDAFHAFDNDLGTMASEAAAGLMISNHSYGLVLGWEFVNGKWEWRGGTNDVDPNFGHYSSKSKTLDEIAYNAPFYTIVQSAGNDRSDTGDGTRPPDGPFDCIGPAAAAKNVMTVGAITGFDQYQNAETPKMSMFSSWGPTDDGRIKPDVVGDGVGVFSTSSSSDDAYTSLQGTSMASPNVAGSIAIVQQFFRQSADTFMTSAALKALTIHTARECGVSDGPDYAFGWGVVNVADAYLVLAHRNSADTLFIQDELANSEVHEYEIFSDGRSPITATIAWTDVPGFVPAQGTTSPRLINDLDIRLYDHTGSESKPWVLNPASPSSQATRGDNFRDNVEKIEVKDPAPGLYTLRIAHKGTLTNGSQRYGLVFTGSGIESSGNVIYWSAAAGAADEAKWSSSSGGPVDAGINPQGKTWVFDQNSPVINDEIIHLNGSVEIENLIWLNTSNSVIDLNGDTLFINHEIIVENPNLKIKNGVIVIRAAGNEAIHLNFDGSQLCSVILANASPARLETNVRLFSLTVNGSLHSTLRDFALNELSVSAGGEMTAMDNDLSITQRLSIGGSIQGQGNTWTLNAADVSLTGETTTLDDQFIFTSVSSLTGSLIAQKLDIHDTFTLDGEVQAEHARIFPGSVISVATGGLMHVTTSLLIDATADLRTSITGLSSASPGVISIGFRELFCLDFLDLENIAFQTASVVNVGVTSTVSNVTGIIATDCGNVIFPDFAVQGGCSNSVLSIENSSLGPIDTYEWDFGMSEFTPGVNDVRDPFVVYDEPGTYTIRLTVRNEVSEAHFERQVEIVQNDLGAISIVTVDHDLVASLFVTGYTWYLNGDTLEGQTQRTLKPTESGSYRVAYGAGNSSCANRVSEAFEYDLVTAIEDPPVPEDGQVSVFPNPFTDHFTIHNARDRDQVKILDMNGRTIAAKQIGTEGSVIRTEHLQAGLYILELVRDFSVYRLKIVKK